MSLSWRPLFAWDWNRAAAAALRASLRPAAVAATNRSTFIPYATPGVAGLQGRMALDTARQQIFTIWTAFNRIDVLSTVDYHLVASIQVPAPNALDI